MKKFKWLHIISEFFNYKNTYWLELDDIKKELSYNIKANWLLELWNFYHLFWKDAYTWVICLAESHISIHTWPESNYLTLDIYVCNYWNDNFEKANNMFKFFKSFYKPEKYNVRNISR